MIYTVVSLYDVFREDASQPIFESYKNGVAEYTEYNGEKRLKRLFSTAPADYLNIE